MKMDRDSIQKRGFSIIRYVDYESQVVCLANTHNIGGRRCTVEVLLSKVVFCILMCLIILLAFGL